MFMVLLRGGKFYVRMTYSNCFVKSRYTVLSITQCKYKTVPICHPDENLIPQLNVNLKCVRAIYLEESHVQMQNAEIFLSFFPLP